MPVVSVLQLILATLLHFLLHELPTVAVDGDQLQELGVFLGGPLLVGEIGSEVVQIPLADLFRISVYSKIRLTGEVLTDVLPVLPKEFD